VSFLEQSVVLRTDKRPSICHNSSMKSSYILNSSTVYIYSIPTTNAPACNRHNSDLTLIPAGAFSISTTETLMSNPFTDDLTHSGKMMLSGMNVKPSAVTQAEIDAFLANGGEIKKIKSKKCRKHSLRSKSHQRGGIGSRYLSGGTRNQSGRSRRSA